jgi:hypothetical protein
LAPFLGVGTPFLTENVFKSLEKSIALREGVGTLLTSPATKEGGRLGASAGKGNSRTGFWPSVYTEEL